MKRRSFLCGVLIGVELPIAARAQGTGGAQGEPKRKPDLGDAAEGTYFGDVISDSKGSSRSDVTLTVTRVGRDLVRVTSDYPRLPVVEVPLTRAMDKILHAGGPTTFLLDRSSGSVRLDVSFLNEVSWSGTRR